jgi:hypothetical protein
MVCVKAGVIFLFGHHAERMIVRKIAKDICFGRVLAVRSTGPSRVYAVCRPLVRETLKIKHSANLFHKNRRFRILDNT